MLVLSRKPGESILLDDRTRITVICTRAGVVRIGITVPTDVNVRRAELHSDPTQHRKRSQTLKH